MFYKFINKQIYCHIFDLSFTQSTHVYVNSQPNDSIKNQEVKNNISAIVKQLNAKNILILNQIHSNQLCDADLIDNFAITPTCDGCITTYENIALAIQTADCVPVLLFCQENNIIGAVHSGFRGAKSNIIKNAATMMRQKGANNIRAIIGPSIQQNSYEVDSSYYDSFINEDSRYSKFFIKSANNNHYMFNLPDFVKMKLYEEQITIDTIISDDTYSNPHKYPSYRRSTHMNALHQKPIIKQSILSTIIIKPL